MAGVNLICLDGCLRKHWAVVNIAGHFVGLSGQVHHDKMVAKAQTLSLQGMTPEVCQSWPDSNNKQGGSQIFECGFRNQSPINSSLSADANCSCDPARY